MLQETVTPFGGIAMSGISGVPAHISKLIDAAAQQSQTETQISFAVAGKQMKAQQAAGDAAVQLIEQAVNVQKQLASGHLDVRV